MARHLRYFEALREAQAQLLATDPRTYVIGLGVPGPTGVFGTTKGLQEEFGAHRVFDMPSSENAMTGIALGTALIGKRPIMVHRRVERRGAGNRAGASLALQCLRPSTRGALRGAA